MSREPDHCICHVMGREGCSQHSYAALETRIAYVERERDLAVAHDSQPYPTAWAYEQATAALHRCEAVVRAAQTVMDSHRQGHWTPGEFDALEAALASTNDPTPRAAPDHPAADPARRDDAQGQLGAPVLARSGPSRVGRVNTRAPSGPAVAPGGGAGPDGADGGAG